MRDRFSELIEKGVAEFRYTPIAPSIPEQDPICRSYNNIFSIPSDTHMSCLGDGRRVITGHKIGIKKDWNEFVNSCFWGAVDFRTSGYYSVNEFLYKNGLAGHYDVINNDNVYIVEPMVEPTANKIPAESHVREARKSKSDLRGDIYDALSNVAFIYNLSRVNLEKEDWEDAIEWFMDKFFEDED